MAGSGNAHLRVEGDPVLRLEDLHVTFRAKGGATVQAVSGVSLDVLRGETLGVVGESGCGKSTMAKAIAQFVDNTGGTIRVDGTDISSLDREERRRLRQRVQMIFQDPIASLNPRRPVEDIIAEPLRIWGRGTKTERYRVVEDTMTACGLAYLPEQKRRRHQFSGGQCQRISIARALVLNPEVLICDEPVSALDVSIQSQILNLLADLRERYQLTMLFISHDLAVIRHVSDRVAVMYLGKLCEVGPADEVFAAPRHHYTQVLLDAIPHTYSLKQGQNGASDAGHVEMPSPLNPPSGCRFRTRCPMADSRCADEEPEIRAVGSGRFVACHHPLGGEIPVQLVGASER